MSKEQMLRWVIGDNPQVHDLCGEWLCLVTEGVTMRINAPVTFTPEQLQSLQVPVLLVLGTKDPLVGDPENVKQLARHVPDIQIEVLNTGHLISAEQPETVNTLIHDFFNR